nr:hypothetical protein [uncultured Pedobacter sp.]
MKKLITILFILPFFAQSQQVQWVSKVLKSSSDLGGKQYSSRRVVGRPDVFPQAGDSPNAWAPKNANDGHDFIEVEFAKAQTVKQIAIFENLNTGCFVKVLAGSGDGKYKEVFRSKSSVILTSFDLGKITNMSTAGADRGYYFGRKRRKVSEAPQVNLKPGIEYANLDEPVENVKALRVVFNFKMTTGDKQIDAIGISDADQPIVATINTTKELENLAKPEIVFTSKNPFTLDVLTQEKLYLSMVDENGLSKIYSLDRANNHLENLKVLPASINKNPDYNYLAGVVGDKFIVGGASYQKGTKETGFSFFKKNDDEFTFEKPLEIVAYNNLLDVANMSANANGNVILMGIESDICQGGMDIYYAKIKEDGTYSFLQNIGKNVNSANDEYNPILCNNEKAILFSSNGFSAYGGDDLYFSLRLDDTWKNWSEPVNLGPQVNDAGNQNSVLYDDTNELIYFTTFKDDAYQICRVKFPKSLFVANN